MAFPRGKGRLFQHTTNAIGDGNVQRRGLGVGTTKPGTEVGRQNAVYASVDITNVPNLLSMDVSHRLGSVPTICELIEVTNAGVSVFAVARPVDKDKWTSTNCRVAVLLDGPTSQAAGTVLKFRIGGQ